MRRAARRRRGPPGGGPQDRHGRLLRPEGFHVAGGAARHGDAPRGPEPVLQRDADRARAARRHRGEVHRRRCHGGLRAPAAPRRRRDAGRAGGRRDAGGARRSERPVRRGLRDQDREPHGREHRRGGRRRCERGTSAGHRRHRERRSTPRAERAHDGDPAGRAYVPPGEGRRSSRAGGAARAEGQVRADARLPAALGRPSRGGRGAPSGRADGGPRRRAHGAHRRTRPRTGDRRAARW